MPQSMLLRLGWIGRPEGVSGVGHHGQGETNEEKEMEIFSMLEEIIYA